MKSGKKPKYNMWQNTGFMIGRAWCTYKSVIFLCIPLAFATAGTTVTELLIAPAILKRVETAAPLCELVRTIALFVTVLLVLMGLRGYIDTNTLFGRVSVRMSIIRLLGDKVAGTSYPNLLDTGFIRSEEKAFAACSSNRKATEDIWTTWTEILTNVIGFLVYLLLLSGLSPLLVCIMAALAAAGYFVNKRIGEWGYRHREEEEKYQKDFSYLRKVATERKYAKDIRIFGLKSWIDEVWDSTMRLYEAFLKRREGIYIWINVVDLLLAFLRNGIAYAYLLYFVLKNGMSASQFLLYFGAISGFTQWVTGILEQFLKLHRQSLELSTVREFLEWPEPFLFEEGEKIERAPDGQYEVRLEHVSFRYPGAKCDTIHDLDLTVTAGERLAIVGCNGAGKTTLVKLLCGFLDPTQGRVLLNGEDIRTYDRRDYYALFSAVFQDFSVLEGSVAENVAQHANEIDENKVRKCLAQAGLTEKIASLPHGIQTKIGREVYEDGVELSGGQIQRLMLARALYKDGPILVLDEPTAALDPISENDIYMKYSSMTCKRTSVFISHRFASTRFCDRIILLADGKIEEEGTYESLLARGGEYARLFEIQSRYYAQEGECDGE